jgi:dTDP-4-amino-4,6-dideoxygalactose transaminase
MINVTITTLPPFKKYVSYLEKIWDTHWVTNQGEYKNRLEKELVKYLKVKNLLAVANGTLAMQLAFKALDLKGEVITTPFTFPATINALIWEGLRPVFADIDPQNFTIDPIEVEKRITSRTSAILAVHVFGNPSYVEELEKIAKRNNLYLIYDAAHAFGVEYKGRSILSWGDVNTLSFHATKTFHTIEGGAIITKRKSLQEKLYLLSNHGIKTYDKVLLPGTNAKMNEFEAVMGLCILESYEQDIQKRKRIYEQYISAFIDNSKIKLQKLHPKLTKFTYPYFPVCFSSRRIRDRIQKVLMQNDIRARKYFFPPGNEFPYITTSSHSLSNSTKISHTVLCLPLYAALPRKDVSRVIDIIHKELKEF